MTMLLRGARKIRPRREIVLGGRRIALLVGGVLVLAAGSFAGGYFAGGGGRTVVVTTPALVDFRDPLAVLDRAVPKVDYTFHERLTAPSAPQTPAAGARPSGPAAASRKPAPARKADLDEVRALEERVRTLVAASSGDQARPQAPRPAAPARTPDTDEELQSALAPRAVVELAEPPTAKPSKKKIARLAPPEKRDRGHRPRGKERGGKFTLQVKAFPERERDRAEELVEHLRQRGLQAYLASGEVPGKGTWLRVRVGRFASRQDAERYRERLGAREKTEAFVAVAR